MNNYKLIKLKEGYIIVSNEKIKGNDLYYSIKGILKSEKTYLEYGYNGLKTPILNHTLWSFPTSKIIASTFIFELPDINFNALEESIGDFNIEKMAMEFEKLEVDPIINGSSKIKNDLRMYYGFIAGFNKCLELNKDKLYTEKQLLKAVEMARDITDGEHTFRGEDGSGYVGISRYGWENKYNDNDIIQSLQPKTEWDIEIELETKCYCGHTTYCECEELEGKPYIQRPKITNNKIKILKV
mgnify:CR=1 FL=1